MNIYLDFIIRTLIILFFGFLLISGLTYIFQDKKLLMENYNQNMESLCTKGKNLIIELYQINKTKTEKINELKNLNEDEFWLKTSRISLEDEFNNLRLNIKTINDVNYLIKNCYDFYYSKK